MRRGLRRLTCVCTCSVVVLTFAPRVTHAQAQTSAASNEFPCSAAIAFQLSSCK